MLNIRCFYPFVTELEYITTSENVVCNYLSIICISCVNCRLSGG